jgi:two-component system, NarL family, sensor kinase
MDKDFTLLITLGIASMLLLAAGFLLIVIRNQRKKWHLQKQMSQLKEQQQNQLIEAAVKSEEGERHRIAETLHDEVGAILSSTRLHFLNIKDASLDEKDKQLFEKSKELLNESVQKIRNISHNLHSSLLKEFGLNEAIRHFLNKTIQGHLIKTETDLDDTYLIQHPQTDMGVYRIIQELVNNILKHAKSNFIKFSSKVENSSLRLTLEYTGNGLAQKEFEELRYKPDGLGLKNIMNRIILLKGDIFYEKSYPFNKIILTVPINEE